MACSRSNAVKTSARLRHWGKCWYRCNHRDNRRGRVPFVRLDRHLLNLGLGRCFLDNDLLLNDDLLLDKDLLFDDDRFLDNNFLFDDNRRGWLGQVSTNTNVFIRSSQWRRVHVEGRSRARPSAWVAARVVGGLDTLRIILRVRVIVIRHGAHGMEVLGRCRHPNTLSRIMIVVLCFRARFRFIAFV